MWRCTSIAAPTTACESSGKSRPVERTGAPTWVTLPARLLAICWVRWLFVLFALLVVIQVSDLVLTRGCSAQGLAPGTGVRARIRGRQAPGASPVVGLRPSAAR